MRDLVMERVCARDGFTVCEVGGEWVHVHNWGVCCGEEWGCGDPLVLTREDYEREIGLVVMQVEGFKFASVALERLEARLFPGAATTEEDGA